MLVEIINNPHSGRGRGPARSAAIANELLRRGHEIRVHQGESREDAARWAGEAAGRADRMIVVGGDGSLSAVLSGLPDSAPPVALSPLGTGNILAQELELPDEPLQIVELVERGRVQRLDICHVNERPSVMVWGFGIDGELMRRAEERRNGTMKKTDYLPLLFSTLRDWEPTPQRVVADGEELGSFDFGFVANIRTYGLPAVRLGPCRYDDGRWEMYLFRKMDIPIGSQAALASLVGRVHRSKHVVFRHVRRVRVEGDEPAPVQVDGDYCGATPVEFTVTDLQLPLLVPA